MQLPSRRWNLEVQTKGKRRLNERFSQIPLSHETDEFKLLRLRIGDDVNEEAEDTLAILHGRVERAVGIGIQFLHRSQHVPSSERVECLIRIDSHVLPGIDVERPLIDEHVILHDIHSLVFVPSVLQSLVWLPISPLISTCLLERLSLATEGRRGSKNGNDGAGIVTGSWSEERI